MAIKKIDGHKILTQYFNHHLNYFIGKCKHSKEIGIIRITKTGVIKIKAYHIFNTLASDLEFWSEEFSQEYRDKYLDNQEIKTALAPLFGVYEDAASYLKLNAIHREFLNEHFFGALKKFFGEMDRLYNFDYFTKKASQININQDVVSDLEFAQQYFGRAGFGVAVGKEEVERLKEEYEGEGRTKIKETVEEFAKEAYSDGSVPLQEKIFDVMLAISIDGTKKKSTFDLKRIQEKEAYRVNRFETNGQGMCRTKIWEGDYFVDLLEPKIKNNRKKIRVFSEGGIIKVNFNGDGLIAQIKEILQKIWGYLD